MFTQLRCSVFHGSHAGSLVRIDSSLALFITGNSLDLAIVILMNCNGLLIGAFDEDSPVVTDHQVSLNDDFSRFSACINADGDNLVLIGLDDSGADRSQ
ncbi:hypothetical protein SH528x_006015 [Novipirellula sp. SH528]|uniref:hypothetical protein n=1 Tax=Novipirellula sp. SH528 TaxID=3454466 RepID=UPI003F9FF7B6